MLKEKDGRGRHLPASQYLGCEYTETRDECAVTALYASGAAAFRVQRDSLHRAIIDGETLIVSGVWRAAAE